MGQKSNHLVKQYILSFYCGWIAKCFTTKAKFTNFDFRGGSDFCFTRLLLKHSADATCEGFWYKKGQLVRGTAIEMAKSLDTKQKPLKWKEDWKKLITEMEKKVQSFLKN